MKFKLNPLLPFFFLILIIGSCGRSPKASVATESLDNNFPPNDYVKMILEKAVPDPNTTGMVVGILESDGSTRVVSYGNSGVPGVPLNENSVFEIGSITKVFTGVLLADFVNQDKMRLNDYIEDFLPSVAKIPSFQDRKITFLDLATHTSGLPTMPGNFPETKSLEETAGAYRNYTLNELYTFLSGYDLMRTPGEKQEYSNFLNLIGYSLEEISGESYENILIKRVLNPLGMENTRITATSGMKINFTKGHSSYGSEVPYFVAPVFHSTGGLKSTVSDMLKFAKANLSTADRDIYQALDIARVPRRPLGEPGEFWGLGWGVGENGEMVGHSGATFGYGSYINIDLEDRRAIVVLANFAGPDANSVAVNLMDQEKFPYTPTVDRPVLVAYNNGGLIDAIQKYRTLKATQPEGWDFSEEQLNRFGYYLLNRGKIEDAIQIFQLNVEMFPQSPNPYDSLAEAFLTAGKISLAIDTYRTAVSKAEAAGDPALPKIKDSLQKAIEMKSSQE